MSSTCGVIVVEDPRRVGASSPLPTGRGEVSSPSADPDEGHGHGHGDGHGHGVSADADRKWLAIALVLIVGFMAAEVVVGLLAHSLALISDAGHMLTDAASIVLALVAIRIAARPAGGHYTYGFKRVEILSAQANGITLLLLAVSSTSRCAG